jgi:arylformamidase
VAEWLDLTVPLAAGITAWPGSVGLDLSRTLSLDRGDAVNNSRLDCDVHVGTHVDAPLHHLASGRDAAALGLDELIGPATLVDLPDIDAVRANDLERAGVPGDCRRLLVRTANSASRPIGPAPFDRDFVALTSDAADWIVRRGIVLVGIDYLSIQRFADGPETHRILLAAGVVVVEGLALRGLEPGRYELVCLPLPLVGADGAPARVIARRIGR